MLGYSLTASSKLAAVRTRTPFSSLMSAPKARAITHALKNNDNIFVAEVTDFCDEKTDPNITQSSFSLQRGKEAG